MAKALLHSNELKHFTNLIKNGFFCIQGSWLKNELQFKLDSYSIMKKDRNSGRGGGVCIFIKKQYF